MFVDDILSTARAEVLEKPMLPLSMVNAKYIRISNEIGAGVKAHTFKQMTRYGVAQVITTRATAVPLIEESMEEDLVRVFPIRIGFEMEQDDLELAEANNINIASPKMAQAKETIEREIDIIGFEGKPNTTLRGICNHPNITVIDFPANGNENGGVNSASWKHKTPFQNLSDLQMFALFITSATSNLYNADRMLLPTDALTYYSITPYNVGTGESILTVFLKNQTNLPNGGIKEVIGHPTLNNKGTGGVGRGACYITTSEFNKFHIPKRGDFRDLPYQIQGSTVKVTCQMRTAGVEVQRIKEVVYANFVG